MQYARLKTTLSNSYIFHLLGIILLHLTLKIATGFDSNVKITIINSSWITTSAYLVAIAIIPKISNFLLVDRKYYVLPVLTSVYAIAITLIVLMRIDYARSIILVGFIFTLFWLYISAIFRVSHSKLHLSVIDNFDLSSLKNQDRLILDILPKPYSLTDVKDALVVNLHGPLQPAEEKFIADCSINNKAVYHSASIQEMTDGKVRTDHLSENAIGCLLPNPIYANLKRFWESAIIVFSFPLTLPIMLITAILIKLENPGPAFFIQYRIGQGGKPFKIYKFRSMCVTDKNAASKFATQEMDRITKVGRFIRKSRIDELPQFFNVLIGNMALIGPRPEQESFVTQFEQEIPFYGYRHMVKPGITGWAQTVQGYADDTHSTREKLAHDLYYIKHFSFWLDMNIVLKTLKTMATGFGAK
jgi:lipopolysaccharide/colanic/teichoic acid biosynthesis glycosyltransferase